ncbi:MAG: hypothetical protein JSR54_02000, partial [Proteobacteria bacterium]|nr:hypothetical protein [Pseudomonadota bacterium]
MTPVRSRPRTWPTIVATVTCALAGLTTAAAHASCKTPLPNVGLRGLDASADTDPVHAVAAARSRLDQAAVPPLDQAQLYAIIADAYDTIGDDEEARRAVAAGRASLAGLARDAASDGVLLRLALVEADGAETDAELVRVRRAIEDWEARVDRRSLGYACLLLVRGRIEGRQADQELAARDGLLAYQLAVDLGEADARAEAAYQLGTTYRRAGLYGDASRLEDEVIAYTRARGQTAALATALWEKAQVVFDSGRTAEALQLTEEVRRMDEALQDRIGLAFADAEYCRELLVLQRLDEAASACGRAVGVFRDARRQDQAAGTLDSLARIALARGNPSRALALLDSALANGGRDAAPIVLPVLYRDRAEALRRVGRTAEAFAALQRSLELGKADDDRRRSLAVALLTARQQIDRVGRETQALREQVELERERTASRELTRRLAIGLAVASAALAAILGYLLASTRRHGRELRRQEMILRATAENSPDALALLDARGIVQFANRDLFGGDSAPLPGRPLGESAPAGPRAAVEAALAALV